MGGIDVARRLANVEPTMWGLQATTMTKSRTGRTILVILLVFIVIPITLLFTYPMLYARVFAYVVQSKTGFVVNLSQLEVDLFPVRIATQGLTVRNANLSYGQPVLTLNQLSLTLDARDLIAHGPAWWSASAEGVVLKTGHDKQGRSLWYRPAGPKGHVAQRKSGYDRALFRFGEIDVSDLVYQIPGDQTAPLRVDRLSLVGEAKQTWRLNLAANYRNQRVTAEGTLALPNPDYAQSIDLRASVFGTELRVEGTLGRGGDASGRIKISANAEDLKPLGLLLNEDLTPFAPVAVNLDLLRDQPDGWQMKADGTVAGRKIDVSTRARIEGTTWRLSDLRVQAGDSDLSGKAVVDLSKQTATASLSSQRLDIDQLMLNAAHSGHSSAAPLAAPTTLDSLRQWQLDASLRAEELLYRHYAVRGLNLDADTGSRALHVDCRIAEATANDAQTVAWKLTKPLNIGATLSLARASPDKGTLSVKYRSQGFEGHLHLRLSDVAHGAGNLTLQSRLDDLSAFRGINAQQYAALLPLQLSVQARVSDKELQLNPVKITANHNTITGQMQIDRTTTPIGIRGNLHAHSLELKQISTTAASNIEAVANGNSDASSKLFSDRPIDWSWLTAGRVDLGIRVDKFQFNQTNFRNVRAHLILKDKWLLVEPVSAKLAEGGVRAHLRIRQTRPGAAIGARLVVTNLVPADLGEPDRGLIDGGKSDLFIDLFASGNTPHELASSLDGEIAMEIQRATIRNDIFERIGSDILMQTLNMVNPFVKRDSHTELECAAAHFDAVKGVLTSPNQIVVKTSKMIIRGGGKINLSNEHLQIDLAPSARGGLGIGAGDVARFVRLGGTLENPHPVANPEGILESGATIGAAIATGGVSLLAEGLFNRARNASTQCSKIFEDAVDVPKERQAPPA
jgi:hypothetical protein